MCSVHYRTFILARLHMLVWSWTVQRVKIRCLCLKIGVIHLQATSYLSSCLSLSVITLPFYEMYQYWFSLTFPLFMKSAWKIVGFDMRAFEGGGLHHPASVFQMKIRMFTEVERAGSVADFQHNDFCKYNLFVFLWADITVADINWISYKTAIKSKKKKKK